MKKIVAAFDFDGTLTTKDTFFAFIIHVRGKKHLFRVLLRNFPFLMGYVLKIYPNWKAKEKLFSACFSGMYQSEFKLLGKQFALLHRHLLRHEAVAALQYHLSQQHTVYIVSAGMEAWIVPFFSEFNNIRFLTTRPEIVNNTLTGRLGNRNCYGEEKRLRFLAQEPSRNEYTLYAYGDSKGDRELLKEADHAFYRSFPPLT